MNFFLIFYNLLLFLILIIASPVLLVCMLLFKHYRAGLGERLGFYPKSFSSKAPVLWIHGSSVGEIQTVLPFLDDIKLSFPQYQLFFTATTMTGIDLLKSKKLNCAYFPVDLFPIARKALQTINPKMIWVLETELWPSFIHLAKKKNIPLALINGRLSDYSFKRYKRVKLWVQKVLNQFDKVLVQTREDEARYVKLGLYPSKCIVTGNLKFDAASLKKPTFDEVNEIKHIFGWEENDLVWVAGSTHGEEEKICAQIYNNLSKTFHSLRLILAPRHITRVKDVEKTLKKLNLKYVLRSKLNKKNSRSPIILIDTIGELYKVYSMANVVFIGRSLDGFGGQNPMEPAVFRKPILFGPHMENFRQAAGELLNTGGAFCIQNPEELEVKLQHLLHTPEQARQMGEQAYSILKHHQGAGAHTLQAIQKSN